MSDLISRREAIKAIEDLPNCYNGYSDAYDKACIIGVLEELPPIDAVPKGKWIKMSDADGSYYCCSECGEELYRKWTFDREFDLFPRKESVEKTMYCPNCGADMRGEQDDESRSNSNAQTDTRARGMGATDKSSGI